jgi:hypothetical protein
MRGISRAQIDKQINSHLADAIVADRVGGRSRDEAEHYQRLLRLPQGTTARQELSELERTWQQQREQAVQRDITSATRHRDSASQLANRAQAREQSTAEKLRTEQQRRAELDELTARAERADRQRWREAEVARQEAARQREAQHTGAARTSGRDRGIER